MIVTVINAATVIHAAVTDSEEREVHIERWDCEGRRDDTVVVPANESNELFHGKQFVRKQFAGRTNGMVEATSKMK